MERFEIAREKSRIKKINEIEAFMNDINILHNNTDSVIIPSISITVESEKSYLDYHISKHPNILVYDITFFKKDYPFTIYYSKSFYKNNIPKKHLKQFEELEEYFI